MGFRAVVTAAWISPRFVLLLLWIGDRLSVAFDSFAAGFAGFLLLPWTALAYAVLVESPFPGQHDVPTIGWCFMALGLLADLGTWFVAAREGHRRYDIRA